jgi:hypothetical protein
MSLVLVLFPMQRTRDYEDENCLAKESFCVFVNFRFKSELRALGLHILQRRRQIREYRRPQRLLHPQQSFRLPLGCRILRTCDALWKSWRIHKSDEDSQNKFAVDSTCEILIQLPHLDHISKGEDSKHISWSHRGEMGK